MSKYSNIEILKCVLIYLILSIYYSSAACTSFYFGESSTGKSYFKARVKSDQNTLVASTGYKDSPESNFILEYEDEKYKFWLIVPQDSKSKARTEIVVSFNGSELALKFIDMASQSGTSFQYSEAKVEVYKYSSYGSNREEIDSQSQEI